MNKQWIIERLTERSTWIGFTALLSVVGVLVSPELKEAIIAAGIGIAGVIEVVTKDKK